MQTSQQASYRKSNLPPRIEFSSSSLVSLVFLVSSLLSFRRLV
jgi:hypothetical protein